MIVFRADGNSKIGMGHIMRCLSIANSAKELGQKCLFVVSTDGLQDLITSNGHQIIRIQSNCYDLKSQELDPILDEYNPSAVFVDSYYVSEEFFSGLHEKCKKINCVLVYIDDRCEIAFECDYLINYNIFSRVDLYEKLYSGKAKPLFLLGTQYAPLRKEFQNIAYRENKSSVKNIFVSTGGADSEHFTIDLINEAIKEKSFIFHIVLGMMNLDKSQIEEMAEKAENILIHENVKRMDELMLSCDVAISAAGSTLYELCATQTPCVTYVLVDNQIPAAKVFDDKGIIKNCGDIRKSGNTGLAKDIIEEIKRLSEDTDERNRISDCMKKVVDGKGAGRIIEEVIQE
jgi:UDP-2,4-diacetamido-2,4,6-trideoxy-beta-L-altropyranose hydrolase